MSGVERIAKERQRQIDAEGYDAAHDDEHDDEELAIAAACYAMPERIYVEQRTAGQIHFVDPFPWVGQDARPHPSRGNFPEPERATLKQRMRLLEKAGALIAAEIDRLERSAQ
jgi:hypothetical protein